MSVMLTLSAKGQLTLSDAVLKHLGVAPGGKVEIAKLPGGRVDIVAAPKGSITEVFGLLKRKSGPVLSIAQIKVAAERGWSGKARSNVSRRTAKK